MARTQTMVQLSDELVASLDRSRPWELVIDGPQRSGAAAVGERIADGYRRMPALPDEWGDQLATADIATEAARAP